MDCLVKDIMESTEMTPGNIPVTRKTPSYVRSFAKVTVRIQCKFPVACDKYSELPQLGRFTLRDEGRTIAVGRVTRYKPHKVEPTIVVAGAAKKASEEAKGDKLKE